MSNEPTVSARKREASEPVGQTAKAPRAVRIFVKTRRNQPSVIWGGPKEPRVIVRFSRRGVFKTRSAEVAERLVALGYTEVAPGQKPIPSPMFEPDQRLLQALDDEDDGTDDLDELLEEIDG